MTDLERIRHSAAHVLATALLKIWPEAQLAAGPPVENGFYYDVDLSHRISPNDFEKIEAEMKAVTKANQPFVRSAISRDEAIKLGESRPARPLCRIVPSPSKFKLDILNRIPEGEEISLYTNGDFVDLCAGPARDAHRQRRRVQAHPMSRALIISATKKIRSYSAFTVRLSRTRPKWRPISTCSKEAKKRDPSQAGPRPAPFHISTKKSGRGLFSGLPNGAMLIRQELQKLHQPAKLTWTPGLSACVHAPHRQARETLPAPAAICPTTRESQFPPIVERETLDLLAKVGYSCARTLQQAR